MPTPPCPPYLPLEEGLEHLRARHYGKAIVALRLALRREPGRLAAVRGLATAYLLDGDARSARRTLEEFTLNYPMTAEGWTLAAQLEWKVGGKTRAIEVLRSGLRRLPQSVSLLRLLTVFLAASGHAKPDNSGPLVEYLSQATEHGAGNLRSCTAADANSRADHDWLDQIAQDSALVTALLGAADDAADGSSQGGPMLREIERKLSRLLESQPNHADRQLLLARLRVALGDFPGAVLSLQWALRSNPNFVPAHQLRAQLHARAGDIDGAIEILQQLLKRGLAWPDIHYEIAALEQKRGRAAEARSHLNDAIRLNPGFEQAKELLQKCAA